MKYQRKNKKKYQQKGQKNEPPNGTLKEQFHINPMISTDKRTEKK